MQVLHKHSCMSIDMLLNPAEESKILFETLDEEIHNAVIAAHNAAKNIEISGDNNNSAEVPNTTPPPSHQEALTAALTITSLSSKTIHKWMVLLESEWFWIAVQMFDVVTNFLSLNYYKIFNFLDNMVVEYTYESNYLV